ncbi:MAG TPA: hypothetical protein VFN13_05525 [Rudaea sp.]|nr:hypothetical protein [Rudaea sp.]
MDNELRSLMAGAPEPVVEPDREFFLESDMTGSPFCVDNLDTDESAGFITNKPLISFN